MQYITKMNHFIMTPDYMDGIELDDFQIFMDCFGCIVQDELVAKNLTSFSMLVPFNILIGKTTGDLIVGFSSKKASMGAKSLMWSTISDDDETAVIDKLKNSAKIELDEEYKYFASIPFKVFTSFKEVFSEAKQSVDEYERLAIITRNVDLYEILKLSVLKFINLVKKEDLKIMEFNPIFQARGLTIDENLIFCALPFSNERLEIFDEVIKPGIEKEFGMTVIRSGNIFGPNLNIMESIWTYINKARFVIVDLSEKNPNVFYELGICHTLGKKVITICDSDSLENDYRGKLPFDIGVINTIFYKNKGNGMQKLVNELNLNIQSVIDGKFIISN